MSTEEQQDRLLRWVERVAAFCVEEWGLPPITGRILGWLMICDPAEQSAGQIAEVIQASRASLTSNMRFLTAIGLVKKVRRPGDRVSYYRIEDDAWQKVIQRKLESLSAFGEIADEGLDIAGGEGDRTERIKAAHDSLTWLQSLAARHPLRR
ncbi:GbsR/MarR family transcriptional regulator [Streptosporangium sandarakinum]|uniref:DNA-binding transcriptional regulator GbsR (MarR family) n=1 Tax=Streptosporangium sandarakinum TaxID=1260955 RepID=A0A852UZH0_9ACTN|nr:transcriptional regulator [Streptosporangium sandarakinum]NYF38975.1 DNA-binding transcriptional regulator GbsR (MarR family) [Streptosporangium sandarakinum]